MAQSEFSAGGTVLKMCWDFQVFSMANCPAPSVLTYTVTATEYPGVWFIANIADPTDSGRFAMARIGDQNVYLSAGPTPSNPYRHVWRLGVQDTPVWATGTGRGASTKGSWGTINMTGTGNTRSAINPDGSTATATNVYNGIASRPLGMRFISDGSGSGYFATYNTKLLTLVGAVNPSTAGYVQLNLIDWRRCPSRGRRRPGAPAAPPAPASSGRSAGPAFARRWDAQTRRQPARAIAQQHEPQHAGRAGPGDEPAAQPRAAARRCCRRAAPCPGRHAGSAR